MTDISMLHILLADDEEIVLSTLGDYLRDSGHRVDEARDGSTALSMIEEREYDLSLLDIRMPGLDGIHLLERAQAVRPEMPVVLITGHGNMNHVVQALRIGAADFLTKPVKLFELDAVLEKAVQLRALRVEGRLLRETIRSIQSTYEGRSGGYRLIGESPSTKRVRKLILQAVEGEAETILITGETGTGKEIVAREIHAMAASPDHPFIPVSCPAMAESLVESELFGHVRGSFTGAVKDKAGCFEMADGGTLFLDEIGDLSASAQAKLLRVLETRTLRRVGGSKEIKVDVRVVAATNAPLEKLMEEGSFRRDLFYRLNVYSIPLAPLRERREDIVPLAAHFLRTFMSTKGKVLEGFSKEAKGLLLAYEFPGNARELRNVVERAAILCGSGEIQGEHLKLSADFSKPGTPQGRAFHPRPDGEKILRALEECRWNRREAAKRLEIPYSTLRYRMKKFGICDGD